MVVVVVGGGGEGVQSTCSLQKQENTIKVFGLKLSKTESRELGQQL